MTARTDSGRFSTSGVNPGRPAGVFKPDDSKSWSANVGRLADASYSAYRVIGGDLLFQSVGSGRQSFRDLDGTLEPFGLRMEPKRDIANDVTVSGDMEPATYVSESFLADGTTALFALSEIPFRPSGGSTTQLADNFDAMSLDTRLWSVTDPGSHIGLSSGGLAVSGGNGYDGQTTLAAIDDVELGGSLLFETAGVQLHPPSNGVLCGLYQGVTSRANCLAGFNVRQSGGSTVVAALINGAETGTSFTLQEGHRYTFRLHLHCTEMQRMQQTYYTMVDGSVKTFGGAMVAAPIDLLLELQDLSVSSNT
jgi:hypothetical protein